MSIIQMLLTGVAGNVVTTDPYFNYTTLLLPGNGTNGANNNTFIDSGTANSGVGFSITRGGNTTQGTFTPFSQTGWSNYFDGTGDYLTTPSNAALGMGTGDFTMEFWYYHVSRASTDTILAPSTDNLNIYINTSGVLGYYNGSSAQNSSATVTLNEWCHIALVRSGSLVKMYYNGVEVLSQSNTTNFATASWYIGTNPGNTDPSNGYASNVRIVKGTAVYTGNFAVPTAPLTAITNTQLLTCQSNRFIDNSTNAFTITKNGDTSVQAFSPFNPTAAYSTSTVGGSGYFDGSGDYLSVADNSAFALGSGDFTIESWIYLTSYSPVYFGSYYGATICAKDTANNRSFYYTINGTSSSYPSIVIGLNVSADTFTNTTATFDFKLNTWYHVAVVRSGSTVTHYINGTSQGSGTNSTNTSVSTTALRVGASGFGAFEYYFPGYISNFRLVKGTAVYTSNFTPPTAPLSNITNTSLLLLGTNGGITDATAKNDLETLGNVSISTTQSKFGGSSMYFDGNGDYLYEPSTQNLTFGTGDFTVEFWLYLNTIAADQGVIDMRPASTQGDYPALFFLDSGDTLVWVAGGINRITSSALSASTWYHVAISRSGTSTKMFLNGTQTGSTYTDSTNYLCSRVVIGASSYTLGSVGLNAYINDFRITKGIARYTANFTPPTVAFPVQ